MLVREFHVSQDFETQVSHIARRKECSYLSHLFAFKGPCLMRDRNVLSGKTCLKSQQGVGDQGIQNLTGSAKAVPSRGTAKGSALRLSPHQPTGKQGAVWSPDWFCFESGLCRICGFGVTRSGSLSSQKCCGQPGS